MEKFENIPQTPGGPLRVEPSGTILYEKILTDWLGTVKPLVKESTYVRYTALINAHIIPRLGQCFVNTMTDDLLRRETAALLTAGRLDHTGGLSGKTVTDILFIIKASLRYAKEQNCFVAAHLERLAVKNPPKEMRVLSVAEQERLVKFLWQQPDCFRFGILLSLYTGLRIGELCALQWKDVGREPPAVTVRKTLQRIKNLDEGANAKTKLILTAPKSAASLREIPLPAFLSALAESFRRAPNAFLLSGKEEKPVEPRVMQWHFKQYLQACGIAPANFHALRHTFATRCVELGFEIKTLSEILGHSSVNTTLNRYVHSSFEMKQRHMDMLRLPTDCPTDFHRGN